MAMFRSRKAARHAPRHAAPAADPRVLKTGPFPAVTPGSALTGADFRRPAGQEPPPQHADPADLTATFVPDFAEGAPQDRQRPYVPQDSGPPSSWLRAIPQSGPGSRVLETLTGMPFCAGIRHDPDGSRIGGLCWGAADDIWLVQDFKSVEVTDAAIAALQELREHQAYGGFRAPAVPADPDAAGHREALERELDDCLEQARGVLQAAGNLGFLSAGLKRRNGEGVMDVFVARAELAHAAGRGDGAAAGEAAAALVDIISELCGDETACSIANGIVPSGETVARTGEAPEPEAADEPGDDADEAVTAAGEDAAA